MDGFKLEVIAQDKESLRLAIKLALINVPGKLAKFWNKGETRVSFLWAAGTNSIPFFMPIAEDELTEMVWAWIQSIEFPKSPDTDGYSEKGWKLSTEPFTSNAHQIIFNVIPEWIIHGK